MAVRSEQAKVEALARLAELEAREATLYAEKALALAQVRELWSGADDPQAPFLVLEVATACQIAQSTASVRLRTSGRLVEDLPATLHLLQTGQLTVGQAIVLQKETDGLTQDQCRQVETLALARIGGMTAGDTRREVKRAIVQVDTLLAERRRQQQRTERRVWTSPRPDGRGFVGAEQSAEEAGAFLRALSELADATFDPTDPRTADQQRADAFSHLPQFALEHLESTRPGPTWREFLADRSVTGLRGDQRTGTAPRRRRSRNRRVQAVILVPVETALDLADSPAELIGYGPISGAHARELLAVAELRKACTDARTGRIIALGPPAQAPPGEPLDGIIDLTLTPTELRNDPEPQHDPSRYLADLVRLRDTRCTGPGCAHPSPGCDLEHHNPYPRGETSPDNVGPVSRRCHNAKTHGGWTLTPHPDGSVTWTSPLGAVWTRPARHHPHDPRALTQPRLVWPRQSVELDHHNPHHAA